METKAIKKIMVNELGNWLNKEIVSFYLVQQKELREGKNDKFLRLRLSDSTGSINGNVWANASSFVDRFAEGDVVKVKAIVILYKDQVQLTVSNLKKAEDYEYDLTEFIAHGDKNPADLEKRLFELIDSINDTNLNQMLHLIFDDRVFFSLYARSPAAKSWHHNFMGGLLEHSIGVANICDFAAVHYPVNRDLLITGALLHDVGKVYEYNQKSTIDFTPLGRLVGHLVLGDELVVRHAAHIDNFDPKTLMKLRHLILSHHGEYEKASVRLPQTIEAVVLHFADNLDAQTQGVKQVIDGQTSDSEWSEFDNLNSRYYYIG